MPATTIYTSHDHTIEIHNHRKARLLYDERWASNAMYEDYKRKPTVEVVLKLDHLLELS